VNAIKAIVKDRRIALDVPDDWPEGTEVVIEPLSESIGLSEEDWPATPEGIARHIALMDQVEPFDMTPQEEAAWQADRQARKEYEKAHFDEWADTLQRMWE
jgi:hypothetical protein